VQRRGQRRATSRRSVNAAQRSIKLRCVTLPALTRLTTKRLRGIACWRRRRVVVGCRVKTAWRRGGCRCVRQGSLHRRRLGRRGLLGQRTLQDPSPPAIALSIIKPRHASLCCCSNALSLSLPCRLGEGEEVAVARAASFRPRQPAHAQRDGIAAAQERWLPVPALLCRGGHPFECCCCLAAAAPAGLRFGARGQRSAWLAAPRRCVPHGWQTALDCAPPPHAGGIERE
jgi:hypothetical protein